MLSESMRLLMMPDEEFRAFVASRPPKKRVLRSGRGGKAVASKVPQAPVVANAGTFDRISERESALLRSAYQCLVKSMTAR